VTLESEISSERLTLPNCRRRGRPRKFAHPGWGRRDVAHPRLLRSRVLAKGYLRPSICLALALRRNSAGLVSLRSPSAGAVELSGSGELRVPRTAISSGVPVPSPSIHPSFFRRTPRRGRRGSLDRAALGSRPHGQLRIGGARTILDLQQRFFDSRRPNLRDLRQLLPHGGGIVARGDAPNSITFITACPLNCIRGVTSSRA